MELVAILRSPEGLFALVSRRLADLDMNAVLASASVPESGFSETVELPLTDVPAALCASKEALLTAWDDLRAVSPPETRAVASVLALLRETVMGPEDAPQMPPAAPSSVASPVLPTAAHPRAYRGTKSRPPRPKAVAPVDLRPHLCAPQQLAALLSRLAPAAPEVRDAVRQAERERLLPALFRTHLFSLVRDRGEAAVGALLARHWSLGLETDAALLPAVVRLVRLQDGMPSLQWLDLLVGLPAERRALFADLLLETQAYQVDGLSEATQNLLLQTACGPRAPSRLFGVLRALQHGIPMKYMASGFRLDDGGEGVIAFHEMEWERMSRQAYYPEPTAQRVGLRRGWAAGHLWQQCGKAPRLGHILEKVDWEGYSSGIRQGLLEFYQSFAHSDSGPEIASACWTIVEEGVPRFASLLDSTPPDYQDKLLVNLRQFCADWEDPETLRRCLPLLDSLLRRLCRLPFRPRCDIRSVVTDFIEFLDHEQGARFLAAPDACFQRLEEFCRRDNDATLCGFGTWTLGRRRPDWLLNAFLLHPAKLFKVCKLLGSFSNAQRDSLVRDCGFVDAIAPMPRLLREHEEGTRRLPNTQLAHYQAQWRKQSVLKQLEHLEGAALAKMVEGFSADPVEEAVRHALQMQFQADENRRALRKFLKTYWYGQTDYLWTHPRTQEWLKRHPRLDVALWREGISCSTQSVKRGPLTIAVEQNPLEALKLGTYVGSCLALGGICAYSAAAVVLDINKQVLYARRPDGTVVARQLVALSEEGQLVCFSVYPRNAGAEIQRHFAECDRLFAEALGLPLRHVGGPNYSIQTVLAHGWWDDGVYHAKKESSP